MFFLSSSIFATFFKALELILTKIMNMELWMSRYILDTFFDVLSYLGGNGESYFFQI